MAPRVAPLLMASLMAALTAAGAWLPPQAAGADPAEAPSASAGDNVGRWQQGLRSCRIVISAAEAGSSHGCSTLRLDQLLEGLLTVRLVSTATGGSRPSQQLVFAGVLSEGSRPMRCSEGRCRPRWPLRLLVSAVAQNGFDPRGLALGLPASHLARGECLLERRRLRCSASGSGGLTWSASAGL
jgi:hypothetical protein